MGIVKAGDCDDDDFLTLHEARRAGVSSGTLATAIEKHGVFGWDAYNRFVHEGKSEPLAQRALAALADAQAGVDQDLSSERDPRESPWLNMGWPSRSRPDFDALAAGQRERPRGQEPGRFQSALLLIAALKRANREIRNRLGKPVVPSDAQLIEHLLVANPGVRGLGERTIQGLFADGDALLTERQKAR